MTFWSGDTLEAVGTAGALVQDFDKSRIDCSAYTLRLGHECYVTPRYEDSGPNLKQQLAEQTEQNIAGFKRKVGGGEMVIPAGQFAFLLTQEWIRIPEDAMGFISLKSNYKWKGLSNVSGFHVDPGFHGRLVYSVYNAGPSSIHLARGDELFLLWIANLDGASRQYVKDGTKIQLEIPTKIISEVDRPVHSLQNLSETVETLQRELTLLYRVMAALALAAGLILGTLALPYFAGRDHKSAAVVGVP